MDFKDFVVQMRPLFGQFTLRMAIKCIMEHSGKGVLLLADEIMQSGGEAEDPILIRGTVTGIGNQLNNMTTEFNAVLTTLNILAISNQGSRYIGWIALAPPTLDEATSLFGSAAVQSFVLRQCIADCNGHYRSLETLKLAWDKHPDEQEHYSALIQTLAGAMDRKYSLLTIPLIKAALSGYGVRLNDSPDGKQTYAQYLEQGIYLNTSKESDEEYLCFIPRISPLQLLLFARANINCANDSVVYTPPFFALFSLFFPFFSFNVALFYLLILSKGTSVCSSNNSFISLRPRFHVSAV